MKYDSMTMMFVYATAYVLTGLYAFSRLSIAARRSRDTEHHILLMWCHFTWVGAIAAAGLALTWPVWFAAPAAIKLFIRPRTKEAIGPR